MNNRTLSDAARNRPRDPELDERPELGAPVLWTFAASLTEITAATGLPQRIHVELAALLDAAYGEPLAEAIVGSAAALVQLLVQDGGPGALRLQGTSRKLLIELTTRTEEPPAAELLMPPPQVRDLVGARQGRYLTLGEARSLHVRWVSVALPPARNRSELPNAKPPKDLWN